MNPGMLVRSPLAAYYFGNSSTNIHVCFQDMSGDIKQSIYNGGGWEPGPRGTVGKANLNNGLAITGWGSGNERCYSEGRSGWYDGDLSGRFTAAHYSNLAAMSFNSNGTWCIRVYYQDRSNIIRELVKNGTAAWVAGHGFPAAIQGSSISCANIVGATRGFWVYCQKPDTTLVEYYSAGGSWVVGRFKSQLVYDPGAAISAAVYGKHSHRIFTVDRDNKLCVTEANNGGIWAPTKQLAVTIPYSSVAATPLEIQGPRVRVYLQITAREICEYGTDDGLDYRRYQNPLPTA